MAMAIMMLCQEEGRKSWLFAREKRVNAIATTATTATKWSLLLELVVNP